MSVLMPHEPLQKTPKDSHKVSEPSEIPSGRFRELLRTLPVDDTPSERNFFTLVEEEEEEEKKQIKKEETQLAQTAYIASLPLLLEKTLEFNAIQATFSPQIEALFEKMASCMIIMDSSGETETTLFLDNPHFSSSIFFGAKITIREFSTAPKIFNVEIASSAQAVTALEANKNDLLSAFQKGNFNFSIHRFEAHLQKGERPVLHRKEETDHDSQEKKGGHES